MSVPGLSSPSPTPGRHGSYLAGKLPNHTELASLSAVGGRPSVTSSAAWRKKLTRLGPSAGVR